MPDVNDLFAKAEAAFAAGRLVDARGLLDQVQRLAGDHPAVLHLSALVYKKSGDTAAAEKAFLRALAHAPGDPQINNNYANLLEGLGRRDLALRHYDRALAQNPGFTDARLNRAILLQASGRPADALRDVDALLARGQATVRVHSVRGAALRDLGQFADAAAAYDAALALVSNYPRALSGRARVALESGEAGASTHFRRALAVNSEDPELLIGLAEALESEDDPQALPVLAGAVAANPTWVEGHERLAQMRSETSAPGHFARSYSEAISAHPGDRALHFSHWRTLAQAGRYDEAIEAIDRADLGDDADVRLRRAVLTGEAGDPTGALSLLATLNPGIEVRMAQARAALRLGDWAKAAYLLESVVAEQIGHIAAWAHLGLAWRLQQDPRHEWLCEQPGLFGTLDLDIDAAGLETLAGRLRTLHRTRAHPIGQSLRGGTQTRGNLLVRSDPEILALRAAIGAAVERFLAHLPAADAGHPLLRHRSGALALAGSWSVRLLSSGFHVSHIHPNGVLSSACYVALPATLGGADRAGWLELGNPPDELNLPLPPLATIEPRPGRLALFPSYLYHGTRPFSDGERLTVAFDIVAQERTMGPE